MNTPLLEVPTSTDSSNQSVYKTAFWKAIGNLHRGAMEAVRKSAPERYALMAEGTKVPSLTGMLIGGIKETGAVGAEHLEKGLFGIRKRISDVDTYLGGLGTGGNYKNLAEKSKRRFMFLDQSAENQLPTGKFTPNGNELKEQVVYPSGTKMLSSVGKTTAGVLAFQKGLEYKDQMFPAKKTMETNKGVPS